MDKVIFCPPSLYNKDREGGTFLYYLFGTSVVVGVVVVFLYKKQPSVKNSQTAIYGGQGGIRTLDTLLTYTRVPVINTCAICPCSCF